MARQYEVRVSDEWHFPTFRSAGREFTKGQAVLIHASDPGSAEILSCPFLDAVEIIVPEPEAEQPELDEMKDEVEAEE